MVFHSIRLIAVRTLQQLGRALTEFDLCELETAGGGTRQYWARKHINPSSDLHARLVATNEGHPVGVTSETNINTGGGT